MGGGGMDGGDSSMTMTMKPYFHFGPGDALFFKSWIPTSAAAVFGACVGLLVLAMLERLLAAGRNVLEAQWVRR